MGGHTWCVYVLVDPDELDKHQWEPFFTLHLKTATILKQALVRRGLMEEKSHFHWGIGSSEDQENGWKVSSCVNMKVTKTAGEDRRKLSQDQLASFQEVLQALDDQQVLETFLPLILESLY